MWQSMCDSNGNNRTLCDSDTDESRTVLIEGSHGNSGDTLKIACVRTSLWDLHKGKWHN